MAKWKEQLRQVVFDRENGPGRFEDFIKTEIIEPMIDEIPDEVPPEDMSVPLSYLKQELRNKWLNNKKG